MPKFLFQIKGRDKNGVSNWSWPPVWTDIIEAACKKDAKVIIEENYGRKFPERVLTKDLDNNEFLLSIKELKEDDHHSRSLFEVYNCKRCGAPFKRIEKYQLQTPGGGREYCSYECSSEANKIERYISEENGFHKPCIYRIKNKVTGKSYIGKTTQAFTLRWYQHFFQSKNSETKFHDEIKKYNLNDWEFSVVEILEVPKEFKSLKEINDYIFRQEMAWIKYYDSINNGYNSLASLKEEVSNPDQLEIFNS